MAWSKACVPIIAFLAALASAIRTVQTTAEIYRASGTDPHVVPIAAGAITFSVEGALFLLALAQENQRLRWRSARRKRYVTSIRTIARAISVRLGRDEPLTYDQMPESDNGLNTLIWIAFSFALASNLYLGLKPLTEQMGSNSLQSFVSGIVNARADLQLSFVVDLAAVLFPPLMAFKAGHLTARFASEGTRSTVPIERPPKKQSEHHHEHVQSGASQRVIEHLEQHPEDRSLSQRKLADKLKVSVGTINHVVGAMSANGHENE